MDDSLRAGPSIGKSMDIERPMPHPGMHPVSGSATMTATASKMNSVPEALMGLDVSIEDLEQALISLFDRIGPVLGSSDAENGEPSDKIAHPVMITERILRAQRRIHTFTRAVRMTANRVEL